MTKCLPLLLTVFVSSSAIAQDWRAEPSEDLVEVRGGKMVMEDVRLLKLSVEGFQPVQYQVRHRAEAPAGGLISRDSFVSLATMMFTLTLVSGFAESYDVPASTFLAGYDYTELQAPIGTPDYEINIFMTDEGLQFEFVNTGTGQRNRWTSTWAEVFAK
jgi:hypothetical protein